MKGSPFAKNVFVLLSGTTLAQAISVLSLPILQRIFSPADFGVLNVFVGLTAVIASVSTLKLEYAIVLSRKPEEANVLVSISALSVLIFSCAAAILLVLFGDQVLPQLDENERWAILLLLPWMVCFTGLYEVLNYYFNRAGDFRHLAVGKFIQSTNMEGYRFTSYLASFASNGLLAGRLFGFFSSLTYLAIHYFKTGGKKFSLDGARKLLKTYRDFPLFTMPTVFITLLTNYLFVLHFMEYYGKSMTGIIGVAMQYIALPLGIVASSFSQVFFKRIADVHDPDQLYAMYKRYALNLFMITVAVAVVAYLIPASWPTFVFGEEWSQLMTYVRLTIIWQGVAFVASSLSFIYTRLLKQRVMFFFGLAQLGLVYGSLYLGKELYHEAYPTFLIYALVQAAYYGVTILAAFYFIRTSDLPRQNGNTVL